MYTNILVPVLFDDGHDTQGAFQVAKALADDGARFTVIHILEEIPTYVAAEIPVMTLTSSREKAQHALTESAKALPDAKTMLLSGHAGRAIVDCAEKNGIDCIVLASHKPGLEDFFLGSTASRVVRHAKCAVHVLR